MTSSSDRGPGTDRISKRGALPRGFLQRAAMDPARTSKPMTVIASAVGESAGTIGVSGALILMELAGGTLKVTEVLAPAVQKV
jgi:hypothetical protein